MTSIKVIHGHDVRRLRVAGWEDAKSQILSRFDAREFSAKYIDEDGDHVTISSEDEFQEALAEAKGILRVILSDVEPRKDHADVHSSVKIVEDTGDTVMVEPFDENLVEPTVDEPEEVRPVITESQTEESEIEDGDDQQPTVESVDTEPETDEVKEPENAEEPVDVVPESNSDTMEDVDAVEQQADALETDKIGTEQPEERTEGAAKSNDDQDSARRTPRLFDFLECVLGKGIEELVDNLANMDLREHEEEAEENNSATPKKLMHPGVYCDLCEKTIVGCRYTCLVCPDYDMCTPCYQGKGHTDKHALVIRPIPDAEGGHWQRSDRHRYARAATPIDAFHEHMLSWGRPTIYNEYTRPTYSGFGYEGGCPRLQRRGCAQQRQMQGRRPVTLFRFLDGFRGQQPQRERKVNGGCEAKTDSSKACSSKDATASSERGTCSKKPSSITVRVIGRVTPDKKSEDNPDKVDKTEDIADCKKPKTEESSESGAATVTEKSNTEQENTSSLSEHQKSERKDSETDKSEFVVVESVPDVEEPAPSSSGTSTPKEHLDMMQRLHEMGFTDRSLNAAYIRMYGGDVNEIATRLSERK